MPMTPLNAENEDPQLTDSSTMQDTTTEEETKAAGDQLLECPSDECPSDEDPYDGSSVNREVVQVLKHQIALTEMEASMVPEMDQMLGTYDKVVTALVAENDDLRRRVVDENEDGKASSEDQPETARQEKDDMKEETKSKPSDNLTVPSLKQRANSSPDPIQQFRAYVAMSPNSDKQKARVDRAAMSPPPPDKKEVEEEEEEQQRSPVRIRVIESEEEANEGDEYPGVEMEEGDENVQATPEEKNTEEAKREEAGVVEVSNRQESLDDLRSMVDVDAQSIDEITNLLLKHVEEERAKVAKETQRNADLKQELKKMRYELDAARCDAVLRSQERLTEDAKYTAVEADMKIKSARLEKLLKDREEQVENLTKEVEEFKGKFNRAKQMLLANADLMDTAREIIARGQQPQLPPSTTTPTPAPPGTTSRSAVVEPMMDGDGDEKDQKIAELERQIQAMHDKEHLRTAMIYSTLEDARNFVLEASRASCEAIMASASVGARGVNYIQQNLSSATTAAPNGENTDGSKPPGVIGVTTMVPYKTNDDATTTTTTTPTAATVATSSSSPALKRKLTLRQVDPKEAEDENRDAGQEVAVFDSDFSLQHDANVVVVITPSQQEEKRDDAEPYDAKVIGPGLCEV